MAGIEFTEETRQQAERTGPADLVVGVAGPVAPEELRARAAGVVEELGAGSLRIVFAWPGQTPEAPTDGAGSDAESRISFLPFAPPHSGAEFWSGISANQRAVLALAASLEARACIVVGPDLAALKAPVIQLFAYAILERQCALAMPVYPAGKYDGLMNSGVLSPLSRALYGRRIRYPITFDFAASGAMSARLAQGEPGDQTGDELLWPVAAAAAAAPQAAIGQVHIDVHHQVATAGLELSAVLGQLVGSLFQQMEANAAQWQHIRGSQPSVMWGTAPAGEANGDPSGQAIETQSMLDSFLLGSKNLDEVWRLVLPPNTMLELRRLTRLAPEQFRIPDDLWACIVYDFALAWRLRTISRVHLLGALTPLYLGWAASYVGEVSSLTRPAAEQRLEQFARAWEEKKPYLLSRWRWPDRFNP